MSSYSTYNHSNGTVEVLNVKLKRHNNSVSWGFNIQGGKDFSSPLLIQKITPNSLADRCSLRPGDYLLRIGNKSVENFSHNECRNAIINEGNDLELTVQRRAIPRHEDFIAQYNFTNHQLMTPENVEAPVQPPKLSPQVGVALKDSRVLLSQSYNSPLGLYSKENIANTLVTTIKNPENTDNSTTNSQLSSPTSPNSSLNSSMTSLDKPKLISKLNTPSSNVELNPKPKPFKLQTNSNSIDCVKTPLTAFKSLPLIKAREDNENINDSLFKAYPAIPVTTTTTTPTSTSITATNTPTKMFYSNTPITVSTSNTTTTTTTTANAPKFINNKQSFSINLNPSNEDNESESFNNLSFRRNSDQVAAFTGNFNSNKKPERSFSINNGDTIKNEYNNRFKRMEFRKTFQARLAEALEKSNPALNESTNNSINTKLNSKYNIDNTINDNNNNYIENNNNNNDKPYLRNQLKHLNLNDDIVDEKSIVDNIKPAPPLSPPSYKSLPQPLPSYSNNSINNAVNFVPNFSPPSVQEQSQQIPKTDYYSIQPPYQQQYMPPPPQSQPPAIPPPQNKPQPQYQPVKPNFTPSSAPPVPKFDPQPQAPVSPPSGPRALNRGLKGSAIRKLDHPSIPKCSNCNQVIRGPFISAVGKIWCPNHFTCASCGVNLEDIGFIEENGRLYCESDFEKYFAPKCAKCRRAIVGDCCYAIQKSFHPDCFTCTHCNRKISGGGFHVEDGQPYCTQDYNNLFSAKCAGCHYPIDAGDQFVEALNSNWHVDCFTCSTCHTKLEGIGFVVRSNKPYCKKHAR